VTLQGFSGVLQALQPVQHIWTEQPFWRTVRWKWCIH